MSFQFAPYFDLFGRGLYDAVRNSFHVLTINDDFSAKSLQKNLAKQHPHQPKPKNSSSTSDANRFKSNLTLLCLFNGGILLCGMVCFHYLFLPVFGRLFNVLAGLDSSSSPRPLLFIQHVLTYTFNFLWLIPAFIISKFVNSYWFRDIADIVYKKLTKQHKHSLPALTFSRAISDVTFSLVMQIFFLIQSTIILLIPVPVLNTIFGHVCLCLLYSFYAFEYAWIYGNLNVQQRVKRIESYWPYFLGFGFPLTMLSTQLFKSVIVNECIFSIFFPFAIVAATSVNLDERVKLQEGAGPNIISLNIFAGCIRLTSRLLDMLKKKRPSTVVSLVQ